MTKILFRRGEQPREEILCDGEIAYNEQGIRYVEYDTYSMYQAPDLHDITYKEDLANFKLFKSSDIICQEVISNLRPGQTKKISVMMWLEGEDPECIETLASGKIKISMNLSIPKYIEELE